MEPFIAVYVSGSRICDSSNRQPLCQVLQRVATQQSITHVIYSLYPCPILGQLKSENKRLNYDTNFVHEWLRLNLTSVTYFRYG